MKLLLRIDKKVDEIHSTVVPILTDVSKHLANKGKPPRKQPKKKITEAEIRDIAHRANTL